MAVNDSAHAELWARLEAYEFDKPFDILPFSRKLARDQRWSTDRTARAIEEYRRFLFLAATSPQPVSPSPAVDEVWHLHLTDTRRYWDEFCPQVLGRPLHHEPSRGGPAEAFRLDRQYTATLDAYERAFGAAAPPDLWPRPTNASHRTTWRTRLARALVGASPLAMLGCAQIYNSAAPGAIQGPEFLVLFAVVAICALFVMGLLQSKAVQSAVGKAARQDSFSAYELAHIAGGAARVIQTALVKLRLAGVIDTADNGRRLAIVGEAPADLAPVETTVLSAVDAKGRLNTTAIQKGLRPLRERLIAAGIYAGPQERGRAWLIALLFALPVAALGGVRLYFGHENHRAVGFLIFEMVLFAILTVIVTGMMIGRSPQTKRLADDARAATPALGASGDADPSLLIRMAALFGLGAIPVVMIGDLNRFPVVITSGSDGSSSSGCGGGGGCGGGCGG